jgi:hypothetical protein
VIGRPSLGCSTLTPIEVGNREAGNTRWLPFSGRIIGGAADLRAQLVRPRSPVALTTTVARTSVSGGHVVTDAHAADAVCGRAATR